jgi:GNAT superfamily N-acetyltransferase
MTGPAITYRRMEPERDLDGLRACLIELQDHEQTVYTRLPPGKDVVDNCITHMLERIEACNGRTIIAEVDDEMAGFVTVLTRVISEDPDDGELEYGLVSDLVVLGIHRGKGIGRQLMDMAEAHAKSNGVEWLRIGVLAGNQALYASLGFEPWYVEHEKKLSNTKS